jgi:hypothetical protein
MVRPDTISFHPPISVVLGTGALAVSLAAICGCSSPEVGSGAGATASPSHTANGGGASAAAPTAEPPPAMVFEGPGEKLVRAIGGWRIAAAPRYFGPDNLYDLINGGAEIYMQFGLVKMVTADYRDAAKPGVSVTAEVYDMGSPRGAFGRAARFLEGRRDPSGAGAGLPAAFAERGMLGDGDLVVWQDRYLVHLTLLDESPQATPEAVAAAGAEQLPRIAEALLAGIGGETAPPAALALLPAENRVRRSETWQPERLLDVEGLGSGYTVRYADGENAWLAFATDELASVEAAEAAWKAVRSALAEGRRVAINAAGRRVVGVVQDGDAPLDDALVEKLAAALEGAFAAR